MSDPAFAHLDAAGRAHPYSPEDNARIAAALHSGASHARLAGVALPDGTVLRFEVPTPLHNSLAH